MQINFRGGNLPADQTHFIYTENQFANQEQDNDDNLIDFPETEETKRPIRQRSFPIFNCICWGTTVVAVVVCLYLLLFGQTNDPQME